MAGLVPAIHVSLSGTKNVVPGTSPGMTASSTSRGLTRVYVMLPGMKQRTRGWPSI
jgi:hypothetical protein